MPYINQDDREELLQREAETPGELNYELTMLCLDYVRNKGKTYPTYNDILGALEGCKLEFYRRAVSDLEDDKIEENGDVYQ